MITLDKMVIFVIISKPRVNLCTLTIMTVIVIIANFGQCFSLPIQSDGSVHTYAAPPSLVSQQKLLQPKKLLKKQLS